MKADQVPHFCVVVFPGPETMLSAVMSLILEEMTRITSFTIRPEAIMQSIWHIMSILLKSIYVLKKLKSIIYSLRIFIILSMYIFRHTSQGDWSVLSMYIFRHTSQGDWSVSDMFPFLCTGVTSAIC